MVSVTCLLTVAQAGTQECGPISMLRMRNIPRTHFEYLLITHTYNVPGHSHTRSLFASPLRAETLD